ncbi:hypothetical protein [Marinobacter sp.]|uniref:hypothetical protein n=1 Tax=Marinobacter sp. TaxID=50741 RepID=UPI000C562F6A|nr:hypothetical protein [Marinobacter sp.]MAO14402.1 hypothetical protein [Marinobacter sp.]
MRNESYGQMWAELKSNKLKMFFVIFLVAGGLAGLITNDIDLPWLKTEQIPHSYDQLMKEIYLSGLTTAQKSEKKSEFIGKRVSWQGTVVDVAASSWGNTVALSDGPRRALTDYFLEDISKSDALSLSKEDVVNFSGRIERIRDGSITGYVYLSDVVIE